MSDYVRGPVEGILLRPVKTEDEVATYVVLPPLGRLIGVLGFGARDPICLPGTARPLDGWSIFGHRGGLVH